MLTGEGAYRGCLPRRTLTEQDAYQGRLPRRTLTEEDAYRARRLPRPLTQQDSYRGRLPNGALTATDRAVLQTGTLQATAVRATAPARGKQRRLCRGALNTSPLRAPREVLILSKHREPSVSEPPSSDAERPRTRHHPAVTSLRDAPLSAGDEPLSAGDEPLYAETRENIVAYTPRDAPVSRCDGRHIEMQITVH